MHIVSSLVNWRKKNEFNLCSASSFNSVSSILVGRQFDKVRSEENFFDAAGKVDGANVGVRRRRILNDNNVKNMFYTLCNYFFSGNNYLYLCWKNTEENRNLVLYKIFFFRFLPLSRAENCCNFNYIFSFKLEQRSR
jgi:hypothetical protein